MYVSIFLQFVMTQSLDFHCCQVWCFIFLFECKLLEVTICSIVGYLDQVNKKVASFLVQKLKLSKSAVFQVLKTMKIGDILKNFGKCPKMAYFGQNLAKIWASIARISKTMGAISTIPQVVINYVFLHAKFKFYQNWCSITAAMIFWKFTFFFKIFPNFTFSLKAKYL